ncbi:MAG: hypothetical protein SF123_00350 [Chloroflexota bacterium]|nr:hypothetical protein [Chloroflexota bacterium]
MTPELRHCGTVFTAALRTTTGCAKTYVAQFAEHLDHPHVHFHIIMRADIAIIHTQTVQTALAPI